MPRYKSVYDVLDKIRKDSKNNVSLGKAFEKMTLYFLKNNYRYKHRFKYVQPWDDWSKSKIGNGRVDEGIDLMAYERNGSWTAIQCKCYTADRMVRYENVATFLGTARSLEKKYGTTQMIIVHSGKGISEKAYDKFPKGRVKVINTKKLNSINWNNYYDKLNKRNSYSIWDIFRNSRAPRGQRAKGIKALLFISGIGMIYFFLQIIQLILNDIK